MPTAAQVLAIARSQLGTKESPVGSNHTKYGVWYGMDHEPWCAMFKVHCVPDSVIKRWFVEPTYPEGTKIVIFPGEPKPPDAAVGRWPAPWHKRFYKHIRPARWVNEHWR